MVTLGRDVTPESFPILMTETNRLAYLGVNLHLAGIPTLIPKLDLRWEVRRNSLDYIPKTDAFPVPHFPPRGSNGAAMRIAPILYINRFSP